MIIAKFLSERTFREQTVTKKKVIAHFSFDTMQRSCLLDAIYAAMLFYILKKSDEC